MTRGQAVIAAGLLAPVVPAAAVTVALAFSFNNGVGAVFAFPLAYSAALIAELLLGGPLFLLAWRLRVVAWWSCIAGGAIVGAAVVLILGGFRVSDFRGLAEMAGLGAAAGLVFWLVARLGRVSAPA